MAGKTPSSDEILSLIQSRVDTYKRSVGIVIGVVDSDEPRTVAYGRMVNSRDAGAVLPTTRFAICSITKVFTAMLLAEMAHRDEVRLDEPVENWLGGGLRLVKWENEPITFEHLATHTGGLPNAIDSGLDLQRFLASHVPDRKPGAQYEYSTLSYGILGLALSNRLETDYERLLDERICRPLRLRDTTARVPTNRLATGHDERLRPRSSYDMPELVGGDGIFSTAEDLLKFLEVCVFPRPQSVWSGMFAPRHPTPAPGVDIALGWHVKHHEGGDLYFHSGIDQGFRAFVAFDPAARVGAFALCNASTLAGADDIVRWIVDSRFALLTPHSPLLEVQPIPITRHVSAEVLDRYVGKYQLTPNVCVTVTRNGDHLDFRKQNDTAYELRPETDCRFFFTEVGRGLAAGTRVIFDTPVPGPAQTLIIRKAGLEERFERIDHGPLPMWFGRLAVEITAEDLSRYAGDYEYEGRILSVTQHNHQLFVQATGGRRYELLNAGNHVLFYKSDIVNGTLTFEFGTATIAEFVSWEIGGAKRFCPRKRKSDEDSSGSAHSN